MKTPDEIKKALECCYGHAERRFCEECPLGAKVEGYSEVICTDFDSTGEGALAYIRELEAKLAEYEKPLVPMPEEQIYNDPVWLEMRADNVEPIIADIVPSFTDLGEKAEITLLGNPRRAHLPYDHYGSSWRCWPRKPTDEERKAAKWDE